VRADIWLNPWAQSQGAGYQVVQGLIALAAGGLFGVGLGRGYPGYIPAVHTDYIFAALGEELGLAGLVAVLALYLLLVGRGFRIAQRADDSFETLLAAGLTSILGLQALIIVAGVLRLIPLTGITLPFVSYGGSSLVTLLAAMGLVQSVRLRHRKIEF
jgi:cell division protein FtsW